MEQTSQLLLLAQDQRGAARQALIHEVVELNLEVAHSIAHRFGRRGVPMEDLEQVACVGLKKAVHGFDPSHGHDFLSYAVPSITGEVKRYFRDKAWMVRPLRRIQEMQAAMASASQEMSQRLGRSPTPAELAGELQCDVEDVVEALGCRGCFAPTSIDDAGPAEDGLRMTDRLAEEERGYARAEAMAMVEQACRDLPPRDRRILYLRFIEDMTQEEIGAELGVTQTQVSRLMGRILKRLRQSLESQTRRPSGEQRELVG
jgi:RNA polymerase sigma-B factor